MLTWQIHRNSTAKDERETDNPIGVCGNRDNSLLEDSSPWVSHISKYVVSGGINNTCSGPSFLGCVTKSSLGKQSISLQRREEEVLSSKIMIFPSITEFWAGFLVSHYKRQGCLRFGIPQLWYKPNESSSIWVTLHHPHGTWGSGELTQPWSSSVCCSVNESPLCLTQKSFLFC